jgi:hypothetical protein
MITMREFMELIEYRITEGSEYNWPCYGRDAYCLDSWNGDHDGHSFGIIFDTRTQTVYEVTANDYRHNRAYRVINPDYVAAHRREADSRNADSRAAWDGVDYVDLEVCQDWLNKAQAIAQGLDYDTRVSVPVELEDHELFELMRRAHERDITLNQLVEEILRAVIEKELIKVDSEIK